MSLHGSRTGDTGIDFEVTACEGFMVPARPTPNSVGLGRSSARSTSSTNALGGVDDRDTDGVRRLLPDDSGIV